MILFSFSLMLLCQEPRASEPLSPFPGFMGGSPTFTTRFDNSFNPAMAVVFDGLATASESDDPDSNTARLRLFEIDLASRIDPLGWAYAVIAYEDEGGESVGAVEEAAMWFDDLGGNFSLRGGKYLGDFGKWGTIHQHDRAYVFDPGPSEEFLGGEFLLTGVELHHWFGAGDVPVRWSVGVAPEFGEAESGVDNGGVPEFGGVALGRRTPSSYLYTGRITAQHDVGLNGFFQWGLSALHTPGGLVAAVDTDDNGTVDAELEASQTTVALDLTLRLPDPTDLTGHMISVETSMSSRESYDAASAAMEDREANGIWGYYEYTLNPRWSAGCFGAWWQDAGNDHGADWFTGADAASTQAGFVTLSFSHFNRLRLQVGQDSPVDGEPSWTAALQWTVLLGNHSHPLDW